MRKANAEQADRIQSADQPGLPNGLPCARDDYAKNAETQSSILKIAGSPTSIYASVLPALRAPCEVTPAELPIHVVAWIGIPNEAHDFHKELAVSPQLGIGCF
jgi:hypothetical protein